MTEYRNINSREYWEERFSGSWAAAEGASQTRFFAELGVNLLPSWLKQDISNNAASITDAGCAEGDAVPVLSAAFGASDVSGVDFSKVAIQTAAARYPGHKFLVADLAMPDFTADVVFCSNVLEHFDNPWNILAALSHTVDQHLILMVPGWEIERHPEHTITFMFKDVPRTLPGGLELTFFDAINCASIAPKQWPGYQFIAVYSSQAARERCQLSLPELLDIAKFDRLSGADRRALQPLEPGLMQGAWVDNLIEQVKASDSIHGVNSTQAALNRWELLEATRAEATAIKVMQGSLEAGIQGKATAIFHIAEQQAASLARMEESLSRLDSLAICSEELLQSDIYRSKMIDIMDARLAGLEAVGLELIEKVGVIAAFDRAVFEMSRRLEEKDQEMIGLLAEFNATKAEHAAMGIEKECLQKTLKENNSITQHREIQLKGQLDALTASLERSSAMIAERDGRIDALDKSCRRLVNEIDLFKQDSRKSRVLVNELYASTSWRVTGPLRAIKRVLTGRAPSKGPVQLINMANDQEHQVVASNEWNSSISDGLPSLGAVAQMQQADDFSAQADMSWSDFNEQVLAKRDSYKGIFIQEVVIDWAVPLYQRPQHIAVAMGKLGYLVLYRTVNWTHDDVQGFRKVADNVWLTNSPEVDNIGRAVRSIYSTAYVDTFEKLKSRDPDSIVVYEYIDHIDPQISGDEENIRRLLNLKEWAFSGGVDYVVASAKKLHDEAEAHVGIGKMILSQNGVDIGHYKDPKHGSVVLPTELVEFRKKFENVVGYFGAIAPWLWYDMIESLVVMRPDVGFVFIGPDYYGGVERLPVAENVLYLGAVDYKILPAYARTFDACFIPFSPGEIAQTTSPLKLFEYFALEKPVVVSSDMQECVVYPEVFSGDSPEAIAEAIDAALLVKSSSTFKQRLAELAQMNSWTRRAQKFEKAFQALN